MVDKTAVLMRHFRFNLYNHIDVNTPLANGMQLLFMSMAPSDSYMFMVTSSSLLVRGFISNWRK